MRLSARDISYTAVFVAFAVLAAMLVRYGSAVVPFSLLPFVAVLAGAILGKRLGMMSMGVYILIGLIGIPVFARAPFGGVTYIFQPTFGFLLGFVAAAFVTGWLLEKSHSMTRYLTATFAGMVVIYGIGVPYLWFIMEVYLGNPFGLQTLVSILFPLIFFDLIKAVVASVLAKRTVSHLKKVQPTAMVDQSKQ